MIVPYDCATTCDAARMMFGAGVVFGAVAVLILLLWYFGLLKPFRGVKYK